MSLPDKYDYKAENVQDIFPDMKNLYSLTNNRDSEYQSFMKNFAYLVGVDCWACTVDTEILWNSYDFTSYKTRIIEQTLRSKIIDKPSVLWANIFRNKKDTEVKIYMYSCASHRLVINYTPGDEDTGTLKVNLEFQDEAAFLRLKELKG